MGSGYPHNPLSQCSERPRMDCDSAFDAQTDEEFRTDELTSPKSFLGAPQGCLLCLLLVTLPSCLLLVLQAFPLAAFRFAKHRLQIGRNMFIAQLPVAAVLPEQRLFRRIGNTGRDNRLSVRRNALGLLCTPLTYLSSP